MAIAFSINIRWVSAFRSLLKGDFKEIKAIVRAHWSFFLSLPLWLRKRKVSQGLVTNPQMYGIYPKSIIWEYFAKKKTLFTDLETTLLEKEIL